MIVNQNSLGQMSVRQMSFGLMFVSQVLVGQIPVGQMSVVLLFVSQLSVGLAKCLFAICLLA
jgi:hypothetical protein